MTDADGESRIGSAFTLSADLLVSGGICFDGDVSVVAAEVGKQLDVNGALTVATLNAGSLAADSLKVTEAGWTHYIGGAAAVTQAVDVAGNLSVRGALSAGSVTTGRLSAGALQAVNVMVDSLWLTLNDAQNSITGSATVTEAVNVAGSLEVSGALKADSLQSGSLAVNSLYLTDAAANNLIHGGLSVDNEVAVAGSLSVDGMLSAASLQAGRLTATSLSLTESSADNVILGAASVTNTAEVAGDLTVHGGLSAGSLVSGALSSDSLWLTIDTADNRITGAATIAGAVNVAGSLDIDGALKAASLQAGSLKADSLSLTDSDAHNLIRGNAAISGAVIVEGGLSVDGTLSAEHLQAGSLMAGDVALTGQNVTHSIAGDMTVKNVSLASGATLDVGGKLSLQQGSVSKVEQGATLSAESVELDGASSKLINAGTMELSEGLTVKDGHLQNLGLISKITLEGGTVSGNGSFAGVTMSGGTLVVGNSPGLQTFSDALSATGGEIVFSVAGIEAATSTDAGWESGTYSQVDMQGCELNLQDVAITVAFGGNMAAPADGVYCLTLFANVGNIDAFSDSVLAGLAEKTEFILSQEPGEQVRNITILPNITNAVYTVQKNNIVLNITVGQASIPEPATATLSLLALMSLTARRRRK